MRILSLQIGMPRDVDWNGKTIATGIFKSTVAGSVAVTSTGLVGDGQADLTVHGGRDKAVYAYGWDTLPWWQKARPDDEFTPGIFGENLTVDRLDEAQICAGDVFAVGTARLQAAEPRFPCFKLGIRFDDQKIIATFNDSHRPGVYFRVLQEGAFQAGDELKLVEKDPAGVSIVEMFETKLGKVDRVRYERVLAVKSLSPNWRRKFEAKLAE